MTLANSFANFDFVGAGAKFARMHRNLTLYSAKLRDHCCRLPHAVHAPKVRMSVQEASAKVIHFFDLCVCCHINY